MAREKLIVRELPQRAPKSDTDSVLEDFKKLDFGPGPFPSSDEINYNWGVNGGNPFDKMAKYYGRGQKDLFCFNETVLNADKRQEILEICKEKCGGDAKLMAQFEKRMNVYLKRISGGKADAMEVIGVEGSRADCFFHGCYVAKPGQVRNIHENLNVNLINSQGQGQILETSKILKTVTPKMEKEESRLERLKIYGNGKRLLTAEVSNDKRNYMVSKLAKMELEIEWSIGDVACQVVLEFNGGGRKVGLKKGVVNGVVVTLPEILGYSGGNQEILIRNKSLEQVLEEIGGADKMTIQSKFDCRSKETLMIPMSREVKELLELLPPDIRDDAHNFLLEDIGKLDFSKGPILYSNDKLNWNEGLPANPFNKLRKYWGREKNIFYFMTGLFTEDGRKAVLDLVGRKYEAEGGGAEDVKKFEGAMETFLKRVETGMEDTKIFLEEAPRLPMAFFDGYHVPNERHRRNVHANLNVFLMGGGGGAEEDGGDEWKYHGLEVTRLLKKKTPNFEVEQGLLQRIKFFGVEGRRLTILNKKGKELEKGEGDDGAGAWGRARNYKFNKLVGKMRLVVEWKGVVVRENRGGQKKEVDCQVDLEVENGVFLPITKVSVDGKQLEEPWKRGKGKKRVLELAMQNDQVYFREKTFFEVVKRGLKKAGEEEKEGQGQGKEGGELAAAVADDKSGRLLI